MSYVIVEPEVLKENNIKVIGNFIDILDNYEYIIGFFLPSGVFYAWEGYGNHNSVIDAVSMCSHLNGGVDPDAH